MSDQRITLPWCNGDITVELPAGWHVAGILEPAGLPPVGDPLLETRRSLQQPIGSPGLAELARPGTRVAVVVDDGSRPTPVNCIFPAVIEELARAGVAPGDVTVVAALGVHRAMAEEELAERIGMPFSGGLSWENHDCDDPARLAALGTTQRGTPVLVNRTVAQADLVVSIGCIEPHIIASFGGGYKNIVPGVAGRATIAHNHSLNCTPATFNMIGQPIERNPMRLDLEEAGRMLKPRVFVVNAVLNSAVQVVRIEAGDPIAAHRAGVETSAALYGVRVPAPADLVITNSCPMDQDLRQGVKALGNTIRAVRRGGVQLTLVRADEGVGVFGLANRKLPVGRAALRRLAPLLLRAVPRIKMKGMGEEDRFFLYFALQAMRHGTLLMYGPTIPAGVRENLPFVDFVATAEEGLARARQRLPERAEVVVFPHGGVTYPIME